MTQKILNQNKNQIFRIFDKSKRQYVNPENFDVDCYGNIICTIDNSNYILEWALGSRDNNGTYLFDGDIVKNIASNWRKLGKIDVVKTERYSITWLEHESFGWEGEDLEYPSDCIKIGTINENPELIEMIGTKDDLGETEEVEENE